MEYENNSYGQAQAKTPYSGATAPSNSGLKDRLDQLGMPLAEAINILGMIELRLFGPHPKEVPQDVSPPLDHISGSLELTSRGANEVMNRARRILDRL